MAKKNYNVRHNYENSGKGTSDRSLDQVGKTVHHYTSTSNLTKNGPIYFFTTDFDRSRRALSIGSKKKQIGPFLTKFDFHSTHVVNK